MNEKLVSFARKLRKNQTLAEQILWNRIRAKQLKFKFRRQHIIDKYIVDFICLKKNLIIEIDGGQHAENLTDRKRDEYFTSKGFIVLRFWNNEVIENIDGVLLRINFYLQQDPTQPCLTAGRLP